MDDPVVPTPSEDTLPTPPPPGVESPTVPIVPSDLPAGLTPAAGVPTEVSTTVVSPPPIEPEIPPVPSSSEWGISGATGAPPVEGNIAPSTSIDMQPTMPPPAVPTNPTTMQMPESQPPVGIPGEETLVIPPSSAPSNPFIPQGVAPGAGQPSTPGKGNPLFKRIFMIVVLIFVVVGLIVGGKFALGAMSGSKEVSLIYWGLWENDATLQGILTDFQTKNPKIKVQYLKQSPRQYRERLQAAIARGEGPDIFRFHNTWVPMFRNELAPAPPTVMTPTEFSSTFYPVASADLVGGAAVYGMPVMIDGLGLYYNEDLFATAGVTPPTTWPELLDIVPKLTVRSDTQIQKSAIALGTTGNVENFSDIVALMFMQNGAKLLTPTGKEAEDTLTFYRKFANPADPVYTWNETMDNSIYAFASGKVAMILAPSWRAFDIKQISPALRFKVVPVPQLPGNTVNWASYWVEGVSTKSKYPQQSWEFIKYITSRDVVTKLYADAAKTRLFGEPYARVDLGSTIAADPYVGAYIKEAPTAKSFPLASRTFDNGLNDKLIKYLEDGINSLSQGAAPTAALDTVSAGFTQVFASYGLSTGAAPATTP
jgi:multiple sugar transport system substrate-binding protein